MSSTPPSERELDRIRERVDRFVAQLDEEYYRHLAGLQPTLELEPIYARFADLTALDTAQAVGAAAARDGSRRLRELWRFASETYLGALTREHAERQARVETELAATVDGESIPFRMLRPAIANEPDRERRRRLEDARTELGERHLTPIHLDAARATRAGVRALGAGSYLELYRDRFGLELDRLADGCRELLEATERLYDEWADRLLRERTGVGLGEAERFDVPRVFRAAEWDRHFPADRMLPALETTLADLGIDLRAQRNVQLDVEQRPQKTPRAFCAPIEVPGRVVLVIQPIGGADDWRALFHEAGHTEHYAHVSPGLSVEERRLGDPAVSEGWAMLLGHLVDDAAWLTRRLDFPQPHAFAREGAVILLYLVRRYAAKLLYELELHAADDPGPLRRRYVELLREALRIEPSPSDFLADVDPGFYAAGYLRSWAFEAQLRTFLREELGSTWFARRDAGSLLRELWSLGQKPTAEELLADVTGAELELAAVADRVREVL